MLGMKSWRTVGRSLALLLLSACAWLATPEGAWAKPPKVAEPPATKSYSLPYGLVILGVALGVIVVTRPSNRLNEPKQPVVGKEDH
jgi:hypothetical protein